MLKQLSVSDYMPNCTSKLRTLPWAIRTGLSCFAERCGLVAVPANLTAGRFELRDASLLIVPTPIVSATGDGHGGIGVVGPDGQ